MSLSGNDGKTSEFAFIWRIENFTLCLLTKQRIVSPSFRVKQLQNTIWNLSIDLPGDGNKPVLLNLHRSKTDQGPTCITVKGKLFIAKNNDSPLVLKKDDIEFKLTYHYTDALTVLQKSILENSKDFLIEDTLTVGYQFFIDSEDSPPTITECSARSKLNLKEYSFLLPLKLKFSETISNWNYSAVSSPTASTSTEYPEFQLDLKYHHLNRDENIITITIILSKSVTDGIFQCKLSFYNEENIKYEYIKDYIIRKGQDNQLIKISKDIFNKNSIFSATYLRCEIRATNKEFNSFLEKTVYKYKPREHLSDNFHDEDYLQSNLKKLYSDKILSDFKVIVSDKEFPVHKAVLAAASPVFRAMFESGMSEAETSQVVIEEFSAEAVERMLEFSYSGNVEDLEWNVTLELYRIADKYQIQKLKSVCSSFLKSALCVETVAEVLALADLYKDTHLNKVAKDFICTNSKDVFRSKAWKHFMENNIQVASEAMYHFCKLN